MPRRLMIAVLAICGVLGAVRPSAAQPNTVLNVTALPASCPSAVPNDPNNADDWAAFNCAVGLLPALGGEIYVPAGNYYLSQAVHVTNRNVMFRGEGRRATTLIFNGGYTNGLSFQSTSTTVNYTLGVRSLSLLKEGSSDGGAAIRGEWVPITLANDPGLGHRALGVVTTTIHDVQIGQMHWGVGGPMWTFGIELVNSTAAYINQFDIQGRAWGNGIAAIQIGGGASPTANSKSVATKIRDGRISRYTRGIETRDRAEGIHVEYVSMQEVAYGIQMTDGTGTALTNNRILAVERGIQLMNTNHVAVSHNRIEQFGDANFMGIQIVGTGEVGSQLLRVTGNSITSAGGSAARDGIVLQGKVPEPVIQQNTTLNMNRGIWLQDPGVLRAMLVANINRAATISPVVDSGNTTYNQSNH